MALGDSQGSAEYPPTHNSPLPPLPRSFFITPHSFLVPSLSQIILPIGFSSEHPALPFPSWPCQATVKLPQFLRPRSYISLLEAGVLVPLAGHRQPIILFKVSGYLQAPNSQHLFRVCLIRQRPSCFPPSHSGLLSQLVWAHCDFWQTPQESR